MVLCPITVRFMREYQHGTIFAQYKILSVHRTYYAAVGYADKLKAFMHVVGKRKVYIVLDDVILCRRGTVWLIFYHRDLLTLTFVYYYKLIFLLIQCLIVKLSLKNIKKIL